MTNDKQATHQLLKSFNNNKTQTNQYFKTLCSYIENNSNDDIINKCFEELSDFPRKYFFQYFGRFWKDFRKTFIHSLKQIDMLNLI